MVFFYYLLQFVYSYVDMADGLETAGFESIQNTGNESGEVSQEDLVRVNEQLGESKKYRGMI